MKRILECFLLIFSFSANALIIEPMVIEMTAAQQGSIILSNPSNREIAVDAQVLEIEFTKGNTLKEINSDLFVFPPAFILKPGAKQHIRLIWNSSKSMQKARSFYVRFETPVLQRFTTKTGSNMDVQVDYNALVHISQTKHKSSVILSKQYIKNSQLILEINNIGNKYDFLNNYNLKNNRFSLSNEILIASLGNIFFPPNSKSNLSIPLALLPKNFNAKETLFMDKIKF